MINRTIVHTAEELKEEIKSDLIGSYERLLEFSEYYAPNSELKERTVLLGSDIFESLDEGEEYHIEKDKEMSFVARAHAIIDEISNSAESPDFMSNLKTQDDFRNYFLTQKPENDIVFIGTNLGKTYSDQRFKLENFDVTLRLGEITGLVGENGNGKSTLLKIIAGEHGLSSGTAEYPLFNKGANKDWKVIKQAIGYVPQSIRPWSDLNTVKNHLHYVAGTKGLKGKENEKAVEYILIRLGLKKHEDFKWGQLSGGYQLRFELARQLIWKPKLLVLDEPLANLDIKAQALLLTDLRNLASSVNHSMAILISSQNLHEVETISDNIIFIKEGKAVFNGPVAKIGESLSYYCFEVAVDCSPFQLQHTLAKLKIREIRNNGYTNLIFTEKETTGEILLQEMIQAGMHIKMFRNISKSTRLLFER